MMSAHIWVLVRPFCCPFWRTCICLVWRYGKEVQSQFWDTLMIGCVGLFSDLALLRLRIFEQSYHFAPCFGTEENSSTWETSSQVV